MWQGEVPSRLVVGMVKSQAFNGDNNLNPYHFEHFDVSNIGFFVNGESKFLDLPSNELLKMEFTFKV